MNKCLGCGDIIDLDKSLCERCFRIKNYNEYKIVTKDNADFINILSSINETNDLVVLVVDLFNFNDLSLIRKYISNDILLVLTKRDLLPKNMNEEKLINYDYKIDYVDKIVISSKKNYQFDLLFDLINKYKKSDKVYIVGYTNSGKSTMINKLIYNYSNNDSVITTSPLPNTTLSTIEVNLNDDLVLIDTPGVLDNNDLTNYIEAIDFKKVIPNKEIKPRTYQVKNKQFLVVDKYLIVEASNIDLTFFISNSLDIKRYYKDIDKLNLKKHIIDVNNNDIVIKGFGFIKTNKKSIINIYTLNNVSVFTRDSLI